MVTLSQNVDKARAAAWTEALEPVLLEGERVRAFARSRSLLVRDGIAFINARVFTFYSGAAKERRVVDWIGNEKIRGLAITSKMFRSFAQIDGEEGAVPLGVVARPEITFVEEQVRVAQEMGIASVAAEAMELLELEKAIEKLEREELLEARKQVLVVGDPLKASQWESIHSCARGGELPWLNLSSDGVGCIVAFEGSARNSKHGWNACVRCQRLPRLGWELNISLQRDSCDPAHRQANQRHT